MSGPGLLRTTNRVEGGIVHVVSGGGGAVLYPVGRNDWTAVSESAFHYAVFKVGRDLIHLDVLDIDGREIDAFTIVKGADTAVIAERVAPAATNLSDHLRFLRRTTDRNQRTLWAHRGRWTLC